MRCERLVATLQQTQEVGRGDSATAVVLKSVVSYPVPHHCGAERGGHTIVPVLVVDDDDNIRSLLREVPEEEGYVVFTAEHGGQHSNGCAPPRPRCWCSWA
jgi:hypothetical protein